MKSNFKKHLKYNFIYLFLLLSKFGFGQEPKLILPIGHSAGQINSVQFSPNNRFMVTAGIDNAIFIWQINNNQLLSTLKGHLGGVYSAIFSNDGSQILSASFDGTAKLWDFEKGIEVFTLKHGGKVYSAVFSPDGKYIMTISDDIKNGAIKIWDKTTGKLISVINSDTRLLFSASFSKDSKYIVTSSTEGIPKIWNIFSGKIIRNLQKQSGEVCDVKISWDGNYIATASLDGNVSIYDFLTGKLLYNLLDNHSAVFSVNFSKDGKYLVSGSNDGTSKLWDIRTGKLLHSFEQKGYVYFCKFSQDGTKLLTNSSGSVCIWDINKKVLLIEKIKTTTDNYSYSNIHSADLSDNNMLFACANVNFQGEIDVYSTTNFSSLGTLQGKVHDITHFEVSSNKEWGIIVTKKYVQVWNLFIPKLKYTIGLTREYVNDSVRIDVNSVKISNDDKLINIGYTKWINSSGESYESNYSAVTGDFVNSNIVVSKDTTINVSNNYYITFSSNDAQLIYLWNQRDNKLIKSLKGPKRWINSTGKISTAECSLDGKTLFLPSDDGTIVIWDIETGNLTGDFKIQSGLIRDISLSSDNKRLFTASNDSACIWDLETRKLLQEFDCKDFAYIDKEFKILYTANQNTITTRDIQTGKFLYEFFAVDNSDYLIIDKDNHYDGSESARNLLYFTCGTEIIDLAQMKDALYVPGLVEKIMNGQDINYPKLSDLDICNALPLVEHIENTESNYFYKITPRKLGLEYVEVYVNDKKVMNVSKDELQEENGLFYLKLKEADVKKHFINDAENKVNVVAIARQSGNELRSRGAKVVVVDEKKENLVVPKLFAVMIGINDYKDPDLKLNYPVKDANELGKAVELSALKLLGEGNVIMYQINTNVKTGNGFTTPEKEGIKRALADIGQKAQPEDLIMLFFAGHGVMQGGDEKLFTFLTAEASQSNQIGITTKELQNWLSYEGPNKILANKTILIFDACNSGQATQELMAMARSDDDTRRIRQVEDLKDKSGMFILAASAPNQVAYELPQYEQGLLTYSLLSVLKNNPDILDDGKYLNVQKWFLESEKYLQQLMASLGLKQDAQPFGTANIRIGEVDEEVKHSIELAVEKPMLICANVLNDTTFDDDLGLKMIVNTRLSEISKRGVNQSIVYPRKETENANKINIRYTLNDQTILCEVRLLKSGETLHDAKITGSKSDIDGLVTDIIQEIIKYAK